MSQSSPLIPGPLASSETAAVHNERRVLLQRLHAFTLRIQDDSSLDHESLHAMHLKLDDLKRLSPGVNLEEKVNSNSILSSTPVSSSPLESAGTASNQALAPSHTFPTPLDPREMVKQSEELSERLLQSVSEFRRRYEELKARIMHGVSGNVSS